MFTEISLGIHVPNPGVFALTFMAYLPTLMAMSEGDRSRSALVWFSWGDPPQGNSSRACRGRSHVSVEAACTVPLQGGMWGVLL